MRLSELTNMRILIWGAGREGLEAAKILTSQHCEIAFITDHPDSDNETIATAQRYSTSVLSPTEMASWNPDFVVRSPGVSRYRSELRGLPSSSLLALWMADQNPKRIIGVTGTKGKSTTSTLIAHILTAAGHSVEVAGNIGIPVTQTSPDSDFVVVEISSYQASDCTTSPFVGVLTSLDADHIPWHGSVEQYHRDKLNLFAYPELEYLVYRAGTPSADQRLDSLGVLNKKFSYSNHSVHVALASPQGEAAIKRMGNTTFTMNLELAMDAALAADNSITLAYVLTALDNTHPLPSRQCIVGEELGRVFVDDALASNPLGVIAAIERFDSSRFFLIMGGDERDVDYTALCDAINGTRNLCGVVLLGSSENRMYRSLLTTKVQVHTTHSNDVSAAVEVAVSLSHPGDVIVFSPGAPTPQAIGDYHTRSAQFLDGIKRLNT